ncbi:hypothetical protein [Neolewinella persica]|uniref:hypothetical protein n=1 Tax=Neolewinella persica TaxID=70998 RepID=UPI0003697433|nr:hypothetical protein [Neolewinella persica]
MRILYCLVLVIWMVSLPAQDTYIAQLASEVCNCMERISVESVNRQATNCLREVAVANEKTLLKRYNLVAAESSQRDLLAERLAEDLLRDCPILATLNYDKEEEFRWSDRERPPAPELMLFSSDKGPPADPADSVTGESPIKWLAEGTVKRVAAGRMLLEIGTGNILSFELPSGIARPRRIKSGDELKLSFRREWRKGENRIVHVVTGIEE